MRKSGVGAVACLVLGLQCLVALVPGVAASPAYPDDICATDPVPWANDRCAGRQWGLVNIQAPQAWKHSRGEGVTVAVLDSGADPNHPDLAGNLLMLPGANIVANDAYPCSLADIPRGTTSSDALPIDDNNHGTLMSGIVAAAANSFGVAGVAPSAKIMPVKVLDQKATVTLRNVARGICFAVDHGAHVINMSFGWDPASTLVFEALGELVFEAAGESDVGVVAVRAAIVYAASKGVPVIVSAGNHAVPFCAFPAREESASCVGAVDRGDVKAVYSQFGDELDLVAPGGRGSPSCRSDASVWTTSWIGWDPRRLSAADEILCPRPRSFAAVSGTSPSAPHVAGVAALVVAKFQPSRDAAGTRFVLDRLRQTADDLGVPGYDPVYGHGRINALRAVSAPIR